MDKRSIGQRGEEVAADHLRRAGYEIVARNWRTRIGEIDIVARRDDLIVFVEVRTRSTAGLGTASESVGPRKQRQLVTMANQYLQQVAPSASARIDVIAITFNGLRPHVDHLVGAVDAR